MNKFKNIIHIIKHTIKSCYLCIKYPFLYPRNRWNGKHYTNWKIEEYLNGNKYANGHWDKDQKKMIYEEIKGIKDKAYEFIVIQLDYPDPDGHYYRFIKNVKNRWWVIWYNIVCFINNYIIQIFHCIPTYTEWDEVPTGWNKAFGNQYLKDIKKQLKKDKMLYKWRITQIKEKYGTLRVYCNYGSKELYALIDKYEDISYHTCISCGKPATKLSNGWICPYCDNCYDDRGEPYAIDKDGQWEYNDKN